MSKMKYQFIELNYYEHNKTFPEKSGRVDKVIYERKDCIARLTPYERSTKIHTTYGSTYEVCELIEQIWKKMDE